MPVEDYFHAYLIKKSADCILYSNDGQEFKIHKEVLSETKFLREILSNTKDHCCGVLEILCPCSKEELSHLVTFLYTGEICCEEQIEANEIEKNLVKIFGFPDNFEMDILTEKRFFDHCPPICEKLSLHNERSTTETNLSEISLEDISDGSVIDSSDNVPMLADEISAMNISDEASKNSPEQSNVDNDDLILLDVNDSQRNGIDQEPEIVNNEQINQKENKTPLKIKKLVNCEQCTETFFERADLEVHISSVHENSKSNNSCHSNTEKNAVDPLQKSSVQEATTDKDQEEPEIIFEKQVKKKVDKVSLEIKKLKKCDECNKTFIYTKDLQMHKSRSHKKICTECGYSCIKSSKMKKHMDMVHSKVKQGYLCEKCNKRFKWRNLRNHPCESL